MACQIPCGQPGGACCITGDLCAPGSYCSPGGVVIIGQIGHCVICGDGGCPDAGQGDASSDGTVD
jgi:hypothetical protein